jgi:tetratricopeptide (TPR) repeat protein
MEATMSSRMRTRTIGLGFLRACAIVGATVAAAYGERSVPLYEGMGDHHREVTTTSPLAQKYFDQGLTWAFAFNHDEAIRSFEKAAELDPDCAMAWWGVALCNGPHINNPAVPPARATAAWQALQKAMVALGHATPVERALIEALSKRYADAAPTDRSALDQAYAAAMAKVWEKYPRDPDVGTLYAEALMDLRPWDLWTQDQQPRSETPVIVAVLEDVLRLDPKHPGANHLYIHAVEPSRHPEKANAAAKRLRDLVPGSGHMVHMPSHIYVLTGRWADAAQQNERAISADRAYRKIAPRQGFYHVYMLHNHHMLAFASMMEGRREVAVRAAREVVESVPEDYMKREAALVDPYMGAIYDVLKRFGRWDDILREPGPPSYLPITTAMWRLSRGVAYAAKGDIALAEQERVAFQKAVSQVPEDALMAINPAADILKIAEHFLDGEIAYRRGDIDVSVRALRQAIALEDRLRYMEPPEWMQPVRHTLGAVLMSAGRFEEAETVYRKDLARWPENGWSLYGLSRCLQERQATAEAKEIEERFGKAWSRADSPIASSCLCVPRT